MLSAIAECCSGQRQDNFGISQFLVPKSQYAHSPNPHSSYIDTTINIKTKGEEEEYTLV